MIESVAGSFPRGAKHYRINAYGLINLRGSSQTEDHRFILLNKDNVVIRALLEFLEENTLDSFHLLKEFHTRDISEYISDCCTLTCTYCRNIWKKVDDYNLGDILPPEITIQKYMSFLDGKPVDQGVLEEIEQYRERLRKKCKNEDTLLSKMDTYPYYLRCMPEEEDPPVYGTEQEQMEQRRKRMERKWKALAEYTEPPFPMNYIYSEIYDLRFFLEEKAKSLVFSIIAQLGSIVNSDSLMNEREKFEEDMFEYARDYSLQYMLKDKKIFELIQNIKKDFDTGYKQFLYYQK